MAATPTQTLLIKALATACTLLACSILTIPQPATAAIDVAAVQRDKPVEYAEVAKILRQNCLACHSGSNAEASLILESPAAMLKGGDSGPAIVAKNSGASLLFKLAAHQDEPVMPPADNKVNARNLTPEELGILKLWIDQGAVGTAESAIPLNWQPLPDSISPIFAAAITPTGGISAVGRGNEIILVQTASGRELTRLIDPSLAAQAGSRGNIAHLDLVQSLAFHPQGELLASGAFREIKLWRKQPAAKLAEIPPFAEQPTSQAITSDGKFAAWGLPNGQVLIYELNPLALKQTLSSHQGAVTGVRFSPDGTKLYTVGADKQLCAWNVADGAAVGKLETPAPIHALGVINQGNELLTAEGDNVIRMWKAPVLPPPAEPQKPEHEFRNHGQSVLLLDAHPASRVFISADGSGSVRVWSLDDKNQKLEWNQGGPATGVAVSADGKFVASAGENNIVKQWQVSDGRQLPELKGDSRQRFIVAKLERDWNLAKKRIEDQKRDLQGAEELAKKEADAVPKAKELKTASEKTLTEKKEAIKQPTEEKAKADAELAAALEAQKPLPEALAAAEKESAAAPDNNELKEKVNQAKQKLQQADEQVKQAQNRVKERINALRQPTEQLKSAELAFASAERGIVAAEQSAAKAAAEVETAKQAVTTAEAAATASEAAFNTGKEAAGKTDRPFRAVAFNSTGSLYTTGDDGLLQAWNPQTGESLGVLLTTPSPVIKLQTIENGVLALTGEKSAALWNTQEKWQLERTIGKPDDPATLADRVLTLEFSPDGNLLVSGGGEPSRSGEIKLWNPVDGSLVRQLTDPHSDTIYAARFSPDGQLLATGGADRFVKVFAVADGKIQKAFEGHTHHVLGVAWRLDGRTLVSGSADNAIKVWDLKSGEQLRTIQGFNKEITGLAFVADTMRAMVACGDGNLRLTNVDSGGNERQYGGGGDFVYAVAVSADGKRVAIGGQDGLLRVYDPERNEPLVVFPAPSK
ncbi:MAG: c-type cytochrome domain-containing protein [Pirellulales bacterium]|nr:c-type cytochrome domain-containing protein [Pirellulales bacterium]